MDGLACLLSQEGPSPFKELLSGLPLQFLTACPFTRPYLFYPVEMSRAGLTHCEHWQRRPVKAARSDHLTLFDRNDALVEPSSHIHSIQNKGSPFRSHPGGLSAGRPVIGRPRASEPHSDKAFPVR